MIEVILRDYLSAALSVPVYLEQPETKPECYVVLEKTGSGLRNHIHSAVVALQSYGASLYQAAVLNEQVKRAMAASVALEDVSRAALNSDYNYTDTDTKQYRYQAVYDIVYMETE
jgi:hypothetical protein